MNLIFGLEEDSGLNIGSPSVLNGFRNTHEEKMKDVISSDGGVVTAAQGFTASVSHCGIRKNKSRRIWPLIYAIPCSSAAAIYTQNLVQGAPILRDLGAC